MMNNVVEHSTKLWGEAVRLQDEYRASVDNHRQAQLAFGRVLLALRERHKSNIEFSHACVDQGIDIAVEERSNLIWLARLSDDARDSVWRMCAEAMNITSLRNSARKRLGADFGLQSSEADAKAVLHPVQDAPSSEETTETEETQAETKETDHPAPAESTVVEEDPRVKTVDDWFGPPLQSSGNRPGPRLCDMQGELLDVLYSMVTDPRAPKTNKNRHRKFSARVLFPKLAATGKLPPMTTTKVAWDDPEAGAKIAALLPDIWRLVEAKPKNPEQWWARNVRNRPSIAEAAAQAKEAAEAAIPDDCPAYWLNGVRVWPIDGVDATEQNTAVAESAIVLWQNLHGYLAIQDGDPKTAQVKEQRLSPFVRGCNEVAGRVFARCANAATKGEGRTELPVEGSVWKRQVHDGRVA